MADGSNHVGCVHYSTPPARRIAPNLEHDGQFCLFFSDGHYIHKITGSCSCNQHNRLQRECKHWDYIRKLSVVLHQLEP
jgi:hypothetical protein